MKLRECLVFSEHLCEERQESKEILFDETIYVFLTINYDIPPGRIKVINDNDLYLSDLFVLVTVGSSNDQSFVSNIIPLQQQ